MFIRAETNLDRIDLNRVNYDDLVELSFDRVQQLRLDGDWSFEFEHEDTPAWEATLNRKRIAEITSN